VHIDRHIFFLQASKFERHVDVIRVLVVMHVHLWPESVSILELEQGSRQESVVEEAVKGTEAAAGIVEEVMGERHLVDDVVVSGECSSVV